MADDYCKQLLENWNLEALVPRFADNGIDQHTMPDLTADIIEELIAHVGNRMKFTSKWKEKCAKNESHVQQSAEEFEDTDTTVSVSLTDASSDVDLDPDTDSDTGVVTLNKIKRPHVRTILKGSMEGRAILKTYRNTKTLSRRCSNIIVNLIISEIFKDTNRFKSFRAKDLEAVALEILEVFPSEALGTYDVPAVLKKISRTQKSITARGKLVDKFRNKKQQYKRLTGRHLSEDDFESTNTTDVDMEIEEDVETRNSISWLQQNQAPWELVLSHWKATSKFRRHEIGTPRSRTVSGIFEKWLILRHPMGHELINEDFEYLQLSTESNAIDNWELFFEKIEQLSTVAKEKKPNDLYDILTNENLNTDSKIAVQLSLLPYLIPPKGRVRSKNEHWKPSIIESKDSIIIHAKIPGDVSHIQRKRIDAMDRVKLTVQPYIIVVGPTLQELSTFYVCIDKTLYSVPSTSKAIDFCSKSFHVLDATYPPESEHVWHLVQHGLYKFETKYDKKISYIMEIINVLKR